MYTYARASLGKSSEGLQKLYLYQQCLSVLSTLHSKQHLVLAGFYIFVLLAAIKLYLTVAPVCIFLITRENKQLFKFLLPILVLFFCVAYVYFFQFWPFCCCLAFTKKSESRGLSFEVWWDWLYLVVLQFIHVYVEAPLFPLFLSRAVYGSSKVTDNTNMDTEVDVFSLFSWPGRLGRGSQVEKKLRGSCKM